MSKTLDFYQELLIFPAIDQINLTIDKVKLVLFEPYVGGGLHPDLIRFYENAVYKNRVMFLSGQRDSMNRLYTAAKELKAVETIIANMVTEKVPENNQQFQFAQDIKIKKTTAVLSAAQQTFGVLYYPNKNGIQSADFLMEFKDNNYNGEDQIRKLLIEKQKLLEQTSEKNLRKKCEDRIFTRKEMLWSEIKERAATETTWQWHHPNGFNRLLEECVKGDFWRVRGDYVEKGPFEKEPTSVAVKVISENEKTGKVSLRLISKGGDKIYYEVGAVATTSSLLVENPNNFETDAMKVSFLCVDSRGDYPTGAACEWVREIKIQHKFVETPNGQRLILESQPGVKIKYTTDGSEPKNNGGLYESNLIVPQTSKYVQVVAEYDGQYYACQQIPVEPSKKNELNIDKAKPLIWQSPINGRNTQESYEIINLYQKYVNTVSDIRILLFQFDEKNNDSGYVELNIDDKIILTLEQLESLIDNLKNSFIANGRVEFTLEFRKSNFKSGQTFYDYLNEKQLSLSEIKPEEIIQK